MSSSNPAFSAARIVLASELGCWPYGKVRGVEELLGRDPAERVEQVDRAPDRRVEEDARPPGEGLGESGEIGDAAVGDDQLGVGVRLDEPPELGRDRRQPSPAVDQDRDPPLRRQPENGCEPLVVHEELLGSRVQLDPPRSTVEAALGLRDRVLREVEPDERDQHPAGALGRLERPVVRRPERGMPVGLVQAEGERPGDRVALEERKQLVERGHEPVDVLPHVDVRVEELGALGDEPPHRFFVRRHECECPLEDALHEA